MSNGELVLLLLFFGLLGLIPAAIFGALVYLVVLLLERLHVLKPEKPREPEPDEHPPGWTAPPGWERAGYDLRRDVQ